MSADAVRVLVADDELDARMIGSHLESLGYAPDLASDGDHALAMAATGRYQVLLLDVHMPSFDGVNILRRLHLLVGRPLKVIAITAGRLDSRRAELARLGIDGYMTKPIDLQRLKDELDRVLGKLPD